MRTNFANDPKFTSNVSDIFVPFLNTNAEMLIGDTLVWIENQNIHLLTKANIGKLQDIKANPTLSVLKYSCRRKVIRNEVEENNPTPQTIHLDPGQVDARYQKEYVVDGSGSDNKRKIVYEIYYEAYSFDQSDIRVWKTIIYTNAKLEYWGRCGSIWGGTRCWLPAGETRDVMINANVNGNIEMWSCFVFCSVKKTIPISGFGGTQTITNSDVRVSLYNDYQFTVASDGWTPDARVSVIGQYFTTVTDPGHSLGSYYTFCSW